MQPIGECAYCKAPATGFTVRSYTAQEPLSRTDLGRPPERELSEDKRTATWRTPTCGQHPWDREVTT